MIGGRSRSNRRLIHGTTSTVAVSAPSEAQNKLVFTDGSKVVATDGSSFVLMEQING